MKIFQLLFIILCGQTYLLYSGSYGVDSYFNEPRKLKLIFSSPCPDTSLINVPANARGMSLAKRGCSLRAIEMLDKNGLWLDKLEFSNENKVSIFAREVGEIHRWHRGPDIAYPVGTNKNFVIDKHGNLGMSIESCQTGSECVQISGATANKLGRNY